MLKKILSGLLLLVVLFSCASTKKVDPNFLGDFDPQPLDSVMAAIVTRTAKTLKPRELTLVFSPRENVVQIHHRFMGENVWLYFNEQGRKVLIDSMETYLAEYKAGKLTAANSKKKAYFGKTSAYIRWGLWGAAHQAKPTVRCEYDLVPPKNRPYFIIGNATVGAGDGANSPAVRIALSPAKCKDMIELLKQENLMKLVQELQKEYEKFDVNENDEDGFEVIKKIEENAVEDDSDISDDEEDADFEI